MIYTYELSVQVKKFLKGEVEAFEKIFVMTADDVYFHVSMVISDPEEAERMVIKIYKDMYMQFGRLDKVEKKLDRNELRDIFLRIYANPVLSKERLASGEPLRQE